SNLRTVTSSSDACTVIGDPLGGQYWHCNPFTSEEVVAFGGGGAQISLNSQNPNNGLGGSIFFDDVYIVPISSGEPYSGTYVIDCSIAESYVAPAPTPTPVPLPTVTPYIMPTVPYTTYTPQTGDTPTPIVPVLVDSACYGFGPWSIDVPGDGEPASDFGFQLCIDEYQFTVSLLGISFNSDIVAYLGAIVMMLAWFKT
ncbi:MAG TPA: hypothetical protein VLL52_17830, partial [Anaerolineae bacterium]|nr:hypothetical protein [Anaerolineae bacterium]